MTTLPTSSTIRTLDWRPLDDPDVRAGAIELQSSVHEKVYLAAFESTESAIDFVRAPRTQWRLHVIDKAQLAIGDRLGGSVMEIGAGTAWCSALLSRSPGVESVYAVEYDPFCVETLIPRTVESLQGDPSKLTVVHGSFNRIPLRDEIDFVVSIGALHHSENLGQTLRACFAAMRPGGWLIASEPCENNALTVAASTAKSEAIDPSSERKYGRVTQHKDNSDHYYRLCEYEAHAYAAGFDVHPFVFDGDGDRGADDDVFRARRCYDGFRLCVHYPFFAVEPDMFDPLVLLLHKPG